MVGAGRQVRAAVRAGHSPQPTDAGQTVSAFVLFNADQSQAELTLPEGEPIRLIRQGEEGNWSWQGGGYQLFPWKGYVLKSGDHVLYHGDLTP
jgi:hypothetical protein